MAVDYNCLSADHLEIMNDLDFSYFKNSTCMPTILPACSFFLGIPYSPARKFLDNNLPIALASDFNPGSAPSGNMNFISSLGSIKLKLTPEEVINAVTLNSAYAMGVENLLGSISVGKKANLIITEPLKSFYNINYSFGDNLVKKVMLNGVFI